MTLFILKISNLPLNSFKIEVLQPKVYTLKQKISDEKFSDG